MANKITKPPKKTPKPPVKPPKKPAKPTISPAELADKRRHLSLLTRLKAGEVLSAAESRDLAALGKQWGQRSDKPKASARPKPKLNISQAVVKDLAFNCANMTDAAILVNGNLITRIDRAKNLSDAWQRGRFLRNISRFAGAGATKAEVAIQLGHELPDFERMLADPEAADIWVTAQNNAMLAVKLGIKDQAIAGKGAAMKSLERVFDNNKPRGTSMDIFKMTIDQMSVIAGITRQTLDKWVTEHGLPRSGDKTFDLRVFVKWFEGFSQRKVNVKPQLTAPDSLRDLKAEKLKDEIDVARKKLLDRDAVIAGYIGRLQQFLTIWDRLADGVADKCANMPKQGVAEILANFKDQLRGEFCKVEIEMKLSDDLHKRLTDILTELE